MFTSLAATLTYHWAATSPSSIFRMKPKLRLGSEVVKEAR